VRSRATLIGREESVSSAEAQLHRDDVRVLTITGPGGVGKTRLAQAVASAAAEQFADGVVFVPLQAIRDPGHVIGTIARALGLFDGEGDLGQRLVAHIEERRLLLVVDNFEQVVDAALPLAAIVAASPHLKALVTSRMRLRVSGEQELPLGPLGRDAAVSMFVDRAREVRPDFEPGAAELEAIAEICDRVDRLPLAIELAAARVKVLSPTAMLARLEHRLELLTAGPRDGPARHRTLRDTIGWSVELLDDAERTLFRRASVFVGGCTLEAVEEVCRGDLEALGSLVEQNLIHADGDRFTMLETIREYASALLEASTEAPEMRRRHAAHYLELALDRAGKASTGALASSERRTRLEVDHDNLRAALSALLESGEAAPALQLCSALWRFWFDRGYLSEGRHWLDRSLAASAEPSLSRARALSGNGILAHYQGDYDLAEQLCREALALSRAIDDPTGTAEAMTGVALVRRSGGDTEGAEGLFREALGIYEHLGDESGIARTLDRLAVNSVVSGDDVHARPLFERSLASFRRLGDAHGVAMGLYGLSVCRLPGARETALSEAVESMDILRAIGDRRTFGKVLWSVAEINGEQGDVETAAAQFAESLTLFVDFGDPWFCVVVIESAASLAAATGDVELAVRLLATADTVLGTIGVPLLARCRGRHDEVLAEARAHMGADRFAAVWEEARRIPLRTAVELIASARSPARTDDADAPDGLTARELEVLALVAEGRSDADVAERLVVSLRTVHAHLRSIYRKLDVHSRTAATRYAFEHGLAA
jgi:predicted ATPase/DNA-binding CsgD family transcriptional regulator